MSSSPKDPPRSRSASPPGKFRTGSPTSPYRYGAFSSFSYGRSPSLKTNEKGGILVSREEIESALKHLASDKRTGRISLAQLKKKLGTLFPEIHSKDFKFLFHNRKDVSVNELTELLLENDLNQFDPLLEAYKAYDPRGVGYISKENIEKVFSSLGFPPLSDTDLDVLLSVADTDNDGKVGFDDFRAILENKGLPSKDDKDADNHPEVILNDLEHGPAT